MRASYLGEGLKELTLQVQACKEALAHTQAWKTNIGATVKKGRKVLRKLDEILLGTSKQRTLRHAFEVFENCPRPKKMLPAKLRSQTSLRLLQSMLISNLLHLFSFSWRHPFSAGSWLAHGVSQGPQELVPSLSPRPGCMDLSSSWPALLSPMISLDAARLAVDWL